MGGSSPVFASLAGSRGIYRGVGDELWAEPTHGGLTSPRVRGLVKGSVSYFNPSRVDWFEKIFEKGCI